MESTSDLVSHQQAEREKHGAALSSVAAAVLLTSMKLVVGIMTGSLGILAEAAHSGLDLVAAAVTFFAVRISGRPADREHTYGHGKVENLSALFETLLLLLTCVWIIYEAIQRLFFKSVEVDPSVWAFVIMSISIVVDISRSRMLYRVAKKYRSQALEADALHFSTDIWSSSVVIVGLILVFVAERTGIAWLVKADAVAASVVAGIVVWVSLQLGRRTVTALLDGVPASLRDEIVKAIQMPGVEEVQQVRVRQSGPETFVDIALTVQRDIALERAHDIASRAEEAIRSRVPGADVVVHIEPIRSSREDLQTTIRVLAAHQGLSAHGIRIYNLGPSGRAIELHLEVSDTLSVEEAHAQATAFEQTLRNAEPNIGQLITHIEPIGASMAQRAANAADQSQVRRVLEQLTRETGIMCQPHEIMLRRAGGELQLAFHCLMEPGTPITEAHKMTERVESLLRQEVPDLGRVLIHLEPREGNGA